MVTECVGPDEIISEWNKLLSELQKWHEFVSELQKPCAEGDNMYHLKRWLRDVGMTIISEQMDGLTAQGNFVFNSVDYLFSVHIRKAGAFAKLSFNRRPIAHFSYDDSSGDCMKILSRVTTGLFDQFRAQLGFRIEGPLMTQKPAG